MVIFFSCFLTNGWLKKQLNCCLLTYPKNDPDVKWHFEFYWYFFMHKLNVLNTEDQKHFIVSYS